MSAKGSGSGGNGRSADSRGDEERIDLADLVASADDAMVAATAGGSIACWNRGAEKLYGYGANDVVGRPLSMVVPFEGQDGWERWFASAASGEVVRDQQTVHVNRSGAPIDVTVTLSPVCDPAGALTGVCMIARDITAQRAVEVALESTLRELEAALAESREAHERCQRFLADAAHQLRTPMAGIKLCAETLLRGPEQSKRERLLANLVRETSRAARLVAELLTVARLDEGQPLRPAPTDLAALCRDEIDRAWSLAPRLDMVLKAPELTWEVAVDPNAVREILANLLDNARRHARSRIEVAVEGRGRSVEVRVGDDGPGLPERLVDRAFERFVSLDGMGSGLGLAIARDLARAHGGDLTYQEGEFVLRLALDDPLLPQGPLPTAE